MKKKLVFKNLDETDRSSGGVYAATNESMEAFHGLLGDQQFDRVAGICSGGEIGLFVLLPRTKRQLTLIDHNYGAMGFAMLKTLLITEVGGKRAHELVSGGNGVSPSKELPSLIKKLTKKLPDELQYALSSPRTYRRFVSETGVVDSYIRQEWLKLKPEQVEAIEDKLRLIEFVHGDLTDLANRKPFDLLYLSNALEYSGRKGRIEPDKLIPSCVKAGGMVLSTHASSVHMPDIDYDRVKGVAKKVDGTVASGSLRWEHVIHKFEPVAA